MSMPCEQPLRVVRSLGGWVCLLALLSCFALSDAAFAQERDSAPRDFPHDRRAAPGDRDFRDRGAAVPPSLRERLESMAPREREVLTRRLKKMPGPKRRRFFRRWENLDESKRDALFQRWQGRIAQHLEDRGGRDEAWRDHRLRRNERAWRDMKPEKRDHMRRRLERFGRLSPEKQRTVVGRRFSDRSDAEREVILERLRAAASKMGATDRADPPTERGDPPTID